MSDDPLVGHGEVRREAVPEGLSVGSGPHEIGRAIESAEAGELVRVRLGRGLDAPGASARRLLVELDKQQRGALNASDRARIIGAFPGAAGEGAEEFLEAVAVVLDNLRGHGDD